ncbi:pilin [Patescibacteria group bacterium]|nr:pilin [Patescibacteria group bacterium]MBU1663129.1 pilin [Patescibacteria group bacterium]MBU1933675.1 pilin [Patescibacteria group bacterium]MBU2008114.1 pilin [Patescibacteria group bacterium]MBU2233459.1 pilin [Patescibacteria group bacterium]
MFICEASTTEDLKNQLNKAASPGWGSSEPAAETSLQGIVQVVISVFLGLLGIIFLILIIYAGFNWMTAAGEEEKVTKAKDTLQRAVIGLIIIIAAYSITYFVFSGLPKNNTGSPATPPSEGSEPGDYPGDYPPSG